ncbi:YigZ family protein [Anoxybacter fermentans]|uniref:YigZ family protein n=1 Tax=Anoxybacter fermentans TaxID=1323375 RepID=A0A3Q9HUU4_9FIRM|nr:YigZ family protein [Anoxybacter fermentans]AZR74848.1 YigZ family protein [Anoxybacter fermentans]
MSDRYLTVAKEARIQIKVKDSKFIATVAPVTTEEEALAFIEKISKEFHDATHNVSAFKVGMGDQAIKRYDDDGEPAGSSGPPVLQAIDGAGLTNTAVVVTRYFGGTKLGYGGLVRAYGDAAQAGLKEAGVREKVQYLLVKIEVSYDRMGSVVKEIQGGISEIRDIQYSNDGVAIFVDLLPSYLESFKKKMVDVTRGKAKVTVEEEEFRG